MNKNKSPFFSKYNLTVWGVVLLFAAVMGMVATSSFTRKSHRCKIDPAQITHLRTIKKEV